MSGRAIRRIRMPMICQFCQSTQVYGHHAHDRVLISCEVCGGRSVSYYTDRRRWEEPEPSTDLDPFLVREVELGLLSQLDPPAQALYEFIKRFYRRYRYAPTLREMQAGVGFSSPNAVTYRLGQLEALGLIERDYGAARGLRLMFAG